MILKTYDLYWVSIDWKILRMRDIVLVAAGVPMASSTLARLRPGRQLVQSAVLLLNFSGVPIIGVTSAAR